MTKNIIFTGGGSGGHVLPAYTLITKLQKTDFKLFYIGGKNGIEKEIITKIAIPYYGIHTGKLRRYLSLQNFYDFFKFFWGIFEAVMILSRFSKNTLIFSTGGFVSLPVVIAAKLTCKKVFIHEQTSRVGLANKLASFFADRIFISFEDSKFFFPANKTYFTGYPLRDECYTSELPEVKVNGVALASVTKPILFITGGGNGSSLINNLIKDNLEALKKKYFIIHQVGKSFETQFKPFHDHDYFSAPFFGNEIIHLYKIAKIVLSRAGAGTVCELMALKKKSIFIPLKIAQKNEQYFNAREAQQKLGSFILTEDDLPSIDLLSYLDKFQRSGAISHPYSWPNGTQEIIKQLLCFFPN